jgi:hypothetical protein
MEVKPEPKSAAERKVADARQVKTIVDELLTLSERAKRGDPQAEAQVVLLLDENPELVQEIGDLSGRAMQSLVIEATGDVLAIKLSVLRREAALRRGLVPENATMLEKLAADNVILAMEHQQYIDLQYASAAKRGGRLNAWVKLQETASKRVDRSLKSLAFVRQDAARPVRTEDDSERSTNATKVTPNAAAAAKAKAGKSRVRSKPAKRKLDPTAADMPPIVCNEEQHCSAPARPRARANRSNRKPANRVTKYAAMNGAASTNGHAIPEPPITVGAMNGK